MTEELAPHSRGYIMGASPCCFCLQYKYNTQTVNQHENFCDVSVAGGCELICKQ